MKKALYLVPVGLLFFCASVTAQQVNIDSLTLIAQISQDQLELGKLQNMIYQKTPVSYTHLDVYKRQH